MARTIDVLDTEYAGAMRVRVVEMDISNYDDDASGDGEAFTASDAGMHRFQTVQAEVMFGEGSATTVVNCVAQYDWANESVRLLHQSADGTGTTDDELVEVPSNADEGAKVRLTCYGR